MRALRDPAVERRVFTFDGARRTRFDPTAPQPVYMIAACIHSLVAEMETRAEAGRLVGLTHAARHVA